MKKRFSRGFLLLFLPILMISVLALPVHAADLTPKMTPTDPNYEIVVPMVDASEKVHDLADLFTNEEEDELRQIIKSYQDSLSMDAVVVTIDNAEGLSTMEYADDFYDYNGFGFSKGATADDQRNGILFLIDMDNREVWISTTGMAITVYSDASIETILDAAFQYMPNGRYFEAAKAGLDKSLSIGLSEYNKAAQSTTGQQQIKQGIDEDYDVSLINDHIAAAKGPRFSITTRLLQIALIPAGILAVIVILIMLGSHNRSLGTPPLATQAYIGRSGIRHLRRIDLLINTRTSRRRLPESSSSSGSSGGGFGGGGSSHSSSSGSSHGGGGRGF